MNASDIARWTQNAKDEFRVHYLNHGYSVHAETFADAKDIVKRAGFEAAIWRGGQLACSWSPISGWRIEPGFHHLTGERQVGGSK